MSTITATPPTDFAPNNRSTRPVISSVATMETLNPNAGRDAERWLNTPLADLRSLESEVEYEAALFAVDRLMDAQADTPELARLIALTTLVASYEQQHYPL